MLEETDIGLRAESYWQNYSVSLRDITSSIATRKSLSFSMNNFF